MTRWQKGLEDFNATHPIRGSLLSGVMWGILWWLGFGILNHALNLFAFELAMAGGILLFGPAMVIVARRRRSRPPN
jgi:small neutral amino acid transporter SnatA (MarC family)